MDSGRFQEAVLEQLKTLAEGQLSLRKELGTLKSNVAALAEGQQELRREVTVLQNDVGTLAEGQQILQKQASRIEMRLEGEVVEKIRALFDDRSVQMDYFASIRNSLARIETRVDSLARDNIEHLMKVREHDREIRLLRAERGQER